MLARYSKASRGIEELPEAVSIGKVIALSALAQVAPTAVVAAVLGHAKESSVTDSYIMVPIEEQIAALNRAALTLDGEARENVAIFSGAAQKAAVGA